MAAKGDLKLADLLSVLRAEKSLQEVSRN